MIVSSRTLPMEDGMVVYVGDLVLTVFASDEGSYEVLIEGSSLDDAPDEITVGISTANGDFGTVVV